ncbi:hypothetical protein Hamer_G015589 [Homarus americanus]|uniref:Uncharacterized protein n=1 Tax=Homarus americanus TaxID=6706 RepID=A0A8J5JB76_HOMAM|nr:hypothetical protein Hamer_G015589 [Homarus americanus]
MGEVSCAWSFHHSCGSRRLTTCSQAIRDSLLWHAGHAKPTPPLMQLSMPPEFPFQQVAADLFQLNRHIYIAIADHLNGWLKTTHLPHGATSAHLIPNL